jgi:tRNA-Thr(GGU) m(6)t(6)A37 methyltransferase TsaA
MELNFNLKPVGKVVSPIKETGKMPLQGVEAEVVIFPEFTPALDNLEEHSHLWLLCWLHEAARDRLKVVPKRVKASTEPKGVFSLRSPARPNPISLTASRLLKREGNRLFLANIDVIDGTPVLDIKPYSVGWDCIFSARNNSNYQIYQKLGRQEALEDMLRQAANFHGGSCVGISIGVRTAYFVLNHFGLSLQTKELSCRAQARGCLADAVQSLMQANNKRFIRLEPQTGEFWFRYLNQELYLKITPKKFYSVEEVMQASDEEMFATIKETEVKNDA